MNWLCDQGRFLHVIYKKGMMETGAENSAQSRRWPMLRSSKITADGDCSHEIKRCSLLGRKAMTNLNSILKSKDITLLTKIHLVKAMVFPVFVYECESWTIKKAEH